MQNTIGQAIVQIKDKLWSEPAIKIKYSNQWTDLSWSEYFEKIIDVASSLKELGTDRSVPVAILSGTRLEWSLCDLATMTLSGITVPIDRDANSEDIEYILKHSEAQILICENSRAINTWINISSRCPQIKTVVCIDGKDHCESNALSWNEFIQKGQANKATLLQEINSLACAQNLEDIATIVYTSGTTGRPKGVVLTHMQLSLQITETYPLFSIGPGDITLTYLPFSHIVARIEHLGHIYFGYTVAFSEGIDRLRENIVEIKPTIMAAVPRVFEKIYAGILARIRNKPFKKLLFLWALNVGKKVSKKNGEKMPISFALRIQHHAARGLGLDAIREVFGGRLRFSVCGGAPISEDLLQFFHAAGVLILEGYGLTETTGAICINLPTKFKFGTSGLPIGEAQFRIADDGEILIKSKKVMKEYYKDPVETSATLVDGWLHTGDLGEVLSGGEIKFTGRKKDLIKTSSGEYIAPQKIETLIKANPLVSQVVVLGDHQKFVVCLITLDKLALEKWAANCHPSVNKKSDLFEHPQLLKAIGETVREVNRSLRKYEVIKGFKIIPTEFTTSAGELTPSQKIKRHIVEKNYRHILNDLYNISSLDGYK